MSNENNCIPCKIISYATSLGFTTYGLCNIRKHPATSSIIVVIGVLGVSTLAYRDLK